MFVHDQKALGILGSVPVPSQVRDQCGPFGGDRHQETHQIISSQDMLHATTLVYA